MAIRDLHIRDLLRVLLESVQPGRRAGIVLAAAADDAAPLAGLPAAGLRLAAAPAAETIAHFVLPFELEQRAAAVNWGSVHAVGDFGIEQALPPYPGIGTRGIYK